jgi:hypothetical protein
VAVAYRAGSAGAKTTSNTGPTITAGVAPQVDDVACCVAITRSASATVSNLNGWTLIQTIGMTNGTAFVLLRVATSTSNGWAAPILSFNSNVQIGITGLFSGADLPGALDATNSRVLGSQSTSPLSLTSLSAGTNGDAVIATIGMSRGATITWGTFAEDFDVQTGTGTTATTVSSAHALVTTNGSTPTGTATESTAGNGGLGHFILPQAAAATTPVTATRATTWDTAKAITSTRATTWLTLAQVAGSRATTWLTATTAAANRITFWSVVGQVTRTASATWATAATVVSSRSSSWATRQAATQERGTGWATLGKVTVTAQTSWETKRAVAAARGTSWNVLTGVQAARQGLWNVLGGVTTPRSTSWAVLAARAASRATSWAVRTPVVSTRATSWATRRQITAEADTTWAVVAPPGRVGNQVETTWDVAAKVTATRGSTWTVRTPVSASRSTIWGIGGRVSAVRDTSWTNYARIMRMLETAWSVLVPVEAAVPTSWATFSPLTSSRAATWDTYATISATRPTRWAVAFDAGLVDVAYSLGLEERISVRLAKRGAAASLGDRVVTVTLTGVKRYPRETVEDVTFKTVTLNGTPVTTFEYAITRPYQRPTTWLPTTLVDGTPAFLLDAPTLGGLGEFTVWARITASPQKPVVEVESIWID